MTDPQRLSEDAARALLRTRVGALPDGHDIRLIQVGTLLWRGFCVGNGHPYVGGSFLISPDERVWTVSSNPGIHDSDLAVRLLERAFDEGIGDRLDPQKFSDRLHAMTERREDELREFVSDVRGGTLRDTQGRVLP